VELLKKLNKHNSIDPLLYNKTTTSTLNEYIALVDGNRIPTEMPVHTECIIKGDSTIFSIAAASIIAKVTRDQIMLQLHEQYPLYNLAQHKGYPTVEHRSLLLQHGPCEIHRRSYAPVRRALEVMESKSLQKYINTTVPTEVDETIIVEMNPIESSEVISSKLLSKKRRRSCSSSRSSKNIDLIVNHQTELADSIPQQKLRRLSLTVTAAAAVAIDNSSSTNEVSLFHSTSTVEKFNKGGKNNNDNDHYPLLRRSSRLQMRNK